MRSRAFYHTVSMMENNGTLMAFAQIAATFVGFAALVSVLNRDRLGDSTVLTLYRLRVVVLASLVLILGAITPVVLEQFQLSDAAVWRASSVLVLLINIAASIANLSWVRHLDHSKERFANIVLSILAICTVGPLLIMVFGQLPEYASGLFFTFMVFALAQAAFSFVLLLDTLLRGEFGA